MGEGPAEGACAGRPSCARSLSDAGNALPAELERFIFCVGDAGERMNAANADAIWAGESQKFGKKAADVGGVGGSPISVAWFSSGWPQWRPLLNVWVQTGRGLTISVACWVHSIWDSDELR